jgi:hypothetical protein
MFFSHKVILSKVLVVVCCAFVVFAQHAATSSNKQAAALVTAATLTTAARMSAENNDHCSEFFKSMPCVFVASLAALVIADRAYNGEWDLLSSLLRSCGIATDYSAKKNCDASDSDANDDFVDFDASDDTDNAGEEADGCCSGCCSC